jgi:two-component system chemotaxis response regulator CheB
MIRVLVVEDSPTVREFLLLVLGSDPEIEVAGTAETGEEALEAVERTRPDVITMDVHMPKMNGFDATRRIMETRPTPIVIVSGTADVTSTNNAFHAMESGALAVLQRPFGMGHPEYERSATELVRTIKLMSEVKVVRRWPRSRPQETLPADIQFHTAHAPVRLIAIGASTGGPPVLQIVLAGLPRDFPVPILIVQHIAAGFTQGFAEWLAQSSNLPVHVAASDQHVLPGCVYVAPDGFHMAVNKDGRLLLSAEDPENGLRPSVSYLFRSVTNVYRQNAVGVLLTGMGKDGALELKLMKEQGATTIAQDKDTSVVHGMPGEAIRLGGATYILPPEKIPAALTGLVARTTGNRELEMASSRHASPGIDNSSF